MTSARFQIVQQSTGKMAGWLWQDYFRRQLPWIMLAFVLMALEGSMLGLLSFMVRPMFDQIFTAGDRSAVYFVALVIFGTFVVRAFAGFGNRSVMGAVGLWIDADLQTKLTGHLMTLDSTYFQDNSPGGLIERVRGDTLAVTQAFNSVFTAIGRDVIALITLLAVALSIDWVWTLIAMAGVPVLVFPVVLLQRIIRRTTRKARMAAAKISTRLDEIFHGINPIKLNNLEDQQQAKFAHIMRQFVRAQIRSAVAQAGVPGLMDLFAGVGFFGVLIYGGFQIIDGAKTVGEFMSFFTAVALVFEPLRRIGNIAGTWQAALASIERIHDIFAARPGILSPAIPVRPSADTGDIVLRDVHFSYGDLPVLNGLSFVAKKGQTTALVGASGAGKSTVFNVLTRLVEPQSGSVTVGKLGVNQMALSDLRQLFSVVTQDAALFDESLAENIALIDSAVDAAQMKIALDTAFIHDFVNSLPAGLETQVGPRGSNLSGGQRQRVAIARAVLRNTPILLLDEPTSALDAQSEAAVQKALDRLAQGRTTLVIAHRLATILDADKIIVMDQGRVVDQGTHSQLLARKGLYADLHRLQFRT